MHPHLVAEPVEGRARRRHVVAAAELVLVGDGIGDPVQLVDVGADHHRFALDAGIDLGDGHDLRVDRLGGTINLAHELGDCLDAEIDPSAEMRVREVAELQVAPGIEAGLLPEGLHGVVVEAGPGVLPAVEMGHPVGNVHVDAVDAGGRDLAHALHVLLAPGLGVGRDPDILVALRIQKAAPLVNEAGSPESFR